MIRKNNNPFVTAMHITCGCILFAAFVAVITGVDADADAAETADVLRIDGGNEFGWDEDSWYVQVDGVMGGKSSGDLEFMTHDKNNEIDSNNDDDSMIIMKFTGDISLDGGGFSSVRRRINLDLSDYAGVVVTLQADSYPFTIAPTGIHLQFGDSTSRYDFSSAFAIPLSSEGGGVAFTSVYLPMNSFDRATSFGFVCRDNDNDNCQLNDSQINDLSVYVLFQEGNFDVRLKAIEVVKEPRSFPSPPVDFESTEDVIQLLQSTIMNGGSLYDKSYIELCIAMYWSVLNTILSASSSSSSSSSSNTIVSESVKAVICAGLQEENNNSNNSKQDRAWILRFTIDAVIADLQGTDRSSTNNNNNNDLDWLPSTTEADSMEVMCVGRTSPAEGILYDDYSGGTTFLVFDDEIEEDDDDNDGDGGGTNNSTSMMIMTIDDDDEEEEDDVATTEQSTIKMTTAASTEISGAAASGHLFRSAVVWILLVAVQW